MFTFTFNPEHLRMVVSVIPGEATVGEAWVVCFARRPKVQTPAGPAWASVDGWHPMLPFGSQAAAARWAEGFTAETCDAPPTGYDWTPLYDDGNETAARELFVVLTDGSEHQADIAIAPLSMLAEGSAR